MDEDDGPIFFVIDEHAVVQPFQFFNAFRVGGINPAGYRKGKLGQDKLGIVLVPEAVLQDLQMQLSDDADDKTFQADVFLPEDLDGAVLG